MFWTTVGELALSGVSLLASAMIRGSGDWRFWLNLESGVLGAGYFAALVALALAALKLTGADAEPRVRAFALAAVACFAALAVFKPIDLWQTFTESRVAFLDQSTVRWFRVAVSNAATMVLGLALFRAAAQQKVRAPLELLAGAVLVSLGTLAFSLADLDGLGEWRWYARSGLGAIELGLLMAYVHVCRQRLAANGPFAAAGSAPGPERDPAWRAAGEGLSAYAGAVKFRLVVAILLAPIAALSGRSGDLGAVKGAVLMATLASVITGVVMIHGLVRFSRMPADGAPASIAAALIAFGFLFDAWSVALVLRVDSYSYRALSDFTNQAPLAEAGAQVCGAFAVLAVLAAIKNAAPSLADRASAIGWLFAGAGFAMAVLKAVATTIRDAAPLLILALPLLIVLLVGLVRFFGLLTDAVALLQPAHAPAAPPPAQPDA